MRLRSNKYNARGERIDGIYFPSAGEAGRYRELKLLSTTGHIKDLKIHPRYPIKVNDILIGDYCADFEYTEAGKRVVEDYKGMSTDLFKWKKKLFEAIYRQPLRITGRSRRQS